jgi:hypothetical protein
VVGICQGQQCFNDDDCPGGQWCVMGLCVQFCFSDADCDENYICVNYFCEYDPCADVTCPPGMECDNGQCVGGGTGGQGDLCQSLDGCDPGLDCLIFSPTSQAGYCSARCDCMNGTGCPAGDPPSMCMFGDGNDPPVTCWCGYDCPSTSPRRDCPNGGAGWHCEEYFGFWYCVPD